MTVLLLLLGAPSGSRPVPRGSAPRDPRPWRCRRELEELRLELGQERLRRRALQVSPREGLPWPGVSSAPHHSRPLPAGGDRAAAGGAARLVLPQPPLCGPGAAGAAPGAPAAPRPLPAARPRGPAAAPGEGYGFK